MIKEKCAITLISRTSLWAWLLHKINSTKTALTSNIIHSKISKFQSLIPNPYLQLKPIFKILNLPAAVSKTTLATSPQSDKKISFWPPPFGMNLSAEDTPKREQRPECKKGQKQERTKRGTRPLRIKCLTLETSTQQWRREWPFSLDRFKGVATQLSPRRSSPVACKLALFTAMVLGHEAWFIRGAPRPGNFCPLRSEIGGGSPANEFESQSVPRIPSLCNITATFCEGTGRWVVSSMGRLSDCLISSLSTIAQLMLLPCFCSSLPTGITIVWPNSRWRLAVYVIFLALACELIAAYGQLYGTSVGHVYHAQSRWYLVRLLAY